MEAAGSANTLSKKMEWIQVPVAVDSGANSSVTPKDICSVEIKSTPQSIAGQNFFGADGGEIKNHGNQMVLGK